MSTLGGLSLYECRERRVARAFRKGRTLDDRSVGLTRKAYPVASVGRQSCDAYPSDVYPALEDFDYEECPRGFTTAAASLASVGGLQIKSPRLFAPELATRHHSWSGLQISYGTVQGVLYLVLIAAPTVIEC